jgi:hypothetical protein
MENFESKSFETSKKTKKVLRKKRDRDHNPYIDIDCDVSDRCESDVEIEAGKLAEINAEHSEIECESKYESSFIDEGVVDDFNHNACDNELIDGEFSVENEPIVDNNSNNIEEEVKIQETIVEPTMKTNHSHVIEQFIAHSDRPKEPKRMFKADMIALNVPNHESNDIPLNEEVEGNINCNTAFIIDPTIQVVTSELVTCKELEDFNSLEHVPEDKETDNVDFKNVKTVRRIKGQRNLGIVLYGDKSYYSDVCDLNNAHRHIPLAGNKVVKLLEIYIKTVLKYGVTQIVAGHEHGKDNKKCHYQCVVTLDRDINKAVKPFKIEFNGVTLLGMSQFAKNSHALKNYCKKDGEVYFLDDEKRIQNVYKKDKDGKDTAKVDPWSTLVKNKDIITQEEAMDIALTYDPRATLMNYRNFEYAASKITKPQLPEFEWASLPSKIVNKYPIIAKWYTQWCKPEELDRRKSLLLYSRDRAFGKTRFAQSLVNHDDYCVIFRNSFTEAAMKGKQPRLLILDDMSCYDDKNKETWKALCASQPTSIRDCYTNFLWNYNVPCIITTNNINLVANMYLESNFKTQVTFVNVDEYMGPDGTQPQGLKEVEDNFGADILLTIDNKRKDREAFVESKKRERNPIFNVVSNTESADYKSKYFEAHETIIKQNEVICKLQDEVLKLETIVNDDSDHKILIDEFTKRIAKAKDNNDKRFNSMQYELQERIDQLESYNMKLQSRESINADIARYSVIIDDNLRNFEVKEKEYLQIIDDLKKNQTVVVDNAENTNWKLLHDQVQENYNDLNDVNDQLLHQNHELELLINNLKGQEEAYDSYISGLVAKQTELTINLKNNEKLYLEYMQEKDDRIRNLERIRSDEYNERRSLKGDIADTNHERFEIEALYKNTLAKLNSMEDEYQKFRFDHSTCRPAKTDKVTKKKLHC